VSEREGEGLSSTLCFSSLPSARSRALGIGFFECKIFFAECQIVGTRQIGLCRVPTDRHSAKYVFKIFAKYPTLDTQQRPSLPSVTFGHSAKHISIFSFPLPNFLGCVPTVCRPTCTILAQL
jgi:hypothetical protein